MLDQYKEHDIKDYLDNLRDSGETNMFGAGAYLEEDFGFSRNLARDMVRHWMNTFGEPEGDVNINEEAREMDYDR